MIYRNGGKVLNSEHMKLRSECIQATVNKYLNSNRWQKDSIVVYD